MSSYDVLAILSIVKPINLLMFFAGIFAVLVIQALPFGKEPKIVLERKDVLIARASHWAGILLILFILYSIAGPDGWAYDDLVFLTKQAILIRPELVSFITVSSSNNPYGDSVCYYGNCSEAPIMCSGKSCFYETGNLSVNGNVFFTSGTNWVPYGKGVMILNQSLPRKPELD